jgi:hypothetical protein
MRTNRKWILTALAVAATAAAPAAANAQACTPLQLSNNPLVGQGYHAFVRINNAAFDLSCYFSVIGVDQIGFDGVSPSVALGAGNSEIKATISQAIFTTGLAPELNYGLASNINTNATTPVDFVFAFAAPLTPTVYGDAMAQIGVTRASGNPNVSIVTAGSPSTVALAGFPTYLRAQTSYLSVAGGGSVAAPFASNLGVDVGGSACTTGTACSYTDATSNPNANISAWATVISYRQARTLSNRASNAGVNGQVTLAAVPEPSSIALVATGIVALVGAGLRRRTQS